MKITGLLFSPLETKTLPVRFCSFFLFVPSAAEWLGGMKSASQASAAKWLGGQIRGTPSSPDPSPRRGGGERGEWIVFCFLRGRVLGECKESLCLWEMTG